MQTWKTRSKNIVLNMGKWLTVENHEVELPDGQLIGDWAWIITPDFINVIPVTEDGKLLFFRQGKYGLKGVSLAVIGGYLEPGEDPLVAARRELLEETGYEAAEWIDLGQYRVDPNRGVAMGSLFLALGARKVTERNADDLEEQELVLLDLAEAQASLLRGEVQCMSWSANLALALLHLQSRG